MRRVLFVDDEAQVLEGLRDALRHRRRDWEMTFALGPQAGLEELRRGGCDVIVTDMGMPGLDGAELLVLASELQPQAVRIVMSGSVALDVVTRAAHVAHRVLSKPCDAAELARVVERSCELNALTRRESLHRAASQAVTLPAPPQAYTRMRDVLADADASAADVAAVLGRDAVFAAHVLRLANSAYFGRGGPVTRLEQAVARIGVGALGSLALASGAARDFASADRVAGLSLEALQSHATEVATTARRILGPGRERDDAFAAGLLHDIGLLVLASQEPDYLQALLSANDARALVELERERRGLTHAEVGAHLLDLWGVPHSIVEAVAFHHRPPERDTALDVVAAVAIAEARANARAPEPGRPRESDAGVDLARWREVLPQAADPIK